MSSPLETYWAKPGRLLAGPYPRYDRDDPSPETFEQRDFVVEFAKSRMIAPCPPRTA